MGGGCSKGSPPPFSQIPGDGQEADGLLDQDAAAAAAAEAEQLRVRVHASSHIMRVHTTS